MRDLRRAKPAPGVIREIVLRKLRVVSVSETGYAGAYDKLLETFFLCRPVRTKYRLPACLVAQCAISSYTNWTLRNRNGFAAKSAHCFRLGRSTTDRRQSPQQQFHVSQYHSAYFIERLLHAAGTMRG